jgi:hypothetical protein
MAIVMLMLFKYALYMREDNYNSSLESYFNTF